MGSESGERPQDGVRKRREDGQMGSITTTSTRRRPEDKIVASLGVVGRFERCQLT